MAVLSIQSSVSYGYVGNSVAVPTLQALGNDAWQINTVHFSNHPGYRHFSGEFATYCQTSNKLKELQKIKVFKNCCAVLSGYLGIAENAKTVAEAVKFVKDQNGEAIYVLDPVIGDKHRVFVKPGVFEAIRDILLGQADFLLPNQYELSWLSGMSVENFSSLISAANALLKFGPNAIIATGIVENQTIANYAITLGGVWKAECPLIPQNFNGTGDLFSALFTGLILKGFDIPKALSTATIACEFVTSETHKQNSKELVVVPVLPQFFDISSAIPAKKII
ncbi:MAG: pyridoxal kinase [Rhodospirillaceae bacterium]|nr:pyridoxal kinase [Rhodospirillaceae bacterium]|tara:strand:- start:3655 stop:4491 length:837 start_codon:yes stop_codon:yes gene_type:complete